MDGFGDDACTADGPDENCGAADGSALSKSGRPAPGDASHGAASIVVTDEALWRTTAAQYLH